MHLYNYNIKYIKSENIHVLAVFLSVNLNLQLFFEILQIYKALHD